MPRNWIKSSFAGVQEGVEQALSPIVAQQALTKIVQLGEVEARIRQLQAQGILPIHAAAHGIGALTASESFDILHHGGQGQAPGSDLNGMPPVGIEIGKELVAINRAELRVQVNVEIALGK